MYKTCTARDKLSQLWHERMSVWHQATNCTFASRAHYQTFAIAKDWIQDAGEALLIHRKSGFCADPIRAYLELCGVLQAAFIVQDAIRELDTIFGLSNANQSCPQTGWSRLRDLRNLTIGHPVNNERNSENMLRKSSIPRGGISYKWLEVAAYVDGKWEHRHYDLSALMERFDCEAASCLRGHYEKLEQQLSAK